MVSGIGMSFAILPILAERWPGPVYAIDQKGTNTLFPASIKDITLLQGCGLSSRPEWKLGFGLLIIKHLLSSVVSQEKASNISRCNVPNFLCFMWVSR
jgi:hypothetical protein